MRFQYRFGIQNVSNNPSTKTKSQEGSKPNWKLETEPVEANTGPGFENRQPPKLATGKTENRNFARGVSAPQDPPVKSAFGLPFLAR